MQDKDLVNSANKYNHNFHGRYCTCDRPYPDTEDEVHIYNTCALGVVFQFTYAYS